MKRTNLRQNINLFIIFISLLVCILLKPNVIEIFDKNLNFQLAIIALINSIVFLRFCYKTNKTWLSYETLFLFGYLIVHFQIPLLASIGIEPNRPSYIWINKQVVNFASWLSLMALLFWMLGYFIFLKRTNVKELLTNKNIFKYKVQTRKVDILLLILFVGFLLLVGRNFLGGGYGGTSLWGTGATYVYMLLKTVLYLRIIYFFINLSNKVSIKQLLSRLLKYRTFTSVLLLYVFLFLVSGDRGPVLEIGILIIFLFAFYQRKIPFMSFLVIGILAAFVFTIIGFGRARYADERKENIFERGYDEFVESNDFNVTNELASSNRILYRALDVVPVNHPYLYGQTFLMEIIGVVPFGGSFYLELADIPEMYFSSSRFFTILGQGVDYNSGEGSEIIGDIYINFGFYGVLILMFLLGLFISYLTVRLPLNQHAILIIYAFMIISAIYISRSDYLEPLKGIFYALLIDRLITKKIKIE